MTQEALAERIGVAWITIQQTETGNNWPKPETIEAIARALRVHPGDLFAPPSPAAPDLQEVLGLLAGVDKAQMPALLIALRSLLHAASKPRPDSRDKKKSVG